MKSFDLLYDPWPWYVAAPLIGRTIPLLLLLDNKMLEVSSLLGQFCALTGLCVVPVFTFLGTD